MLSYVVTGTRSVGGTYTLHIHCFKFSTPVINFRTLKTMRERGHSPTPPPHARKQHECDRKSRNIVYVLYMQDL